MKPGTQNRITRPRTRPGRTRPLDLPNLRGDQPDSAVDHLKRTVRAEQLASGGGRFSPGVFRDSSADSSRRAVSARITTRYRRVAATIPRGAGSPPGSVGGIVGGGLWNSARGDRRSGDCGRSGITPAFRTGLTRTPKAGFGPPEDQAEDQLRIGSCDGCPALGGVSHA